MNENQNSVASAAPQKRFREWLIVTVLLLSPFNAAAQRSIPDDNLAYPVLVELPGSNVGSGFYLNTSTATYLVTAKHVIFDANTVMPRTAQATLLSYGVDPKTKGRTRIAVNLETLFKRGDIKVHQTEDIAVVRIATVTSTAEKKPEERSVRMIDGVKVLEWSVERIIGVGLESVKTLDQVLIANQIILFGYPTSLGLKGLPQLDPLRPLLRKGIVAGINPATKSLIIDCPVYPGNSGGPVLEITDLGLSKRLHVIGVVREFVPFDSQRLQKLPQDFGRSITNSGYGIVTPMDYVLELVN